MSAQETGGLIPNHDAKHRIRFLDGLRGIAVLAVIGWHYYGPTYAAALPYGDRYSGAPLFAHGWAGVYLFFLISGFVIFRTLETSTDLTRFLVRRWIRLAPALLLCSTLLVIAAHLLPNTPEGGYRIRDLAAALTFVSPSFYNAIFDLDLTLVDGAYWTLVIEFSFYVIFGAMYFAFGWKPAMVGLITLWLISAGLRYVSVPFLGRAPEPLWWAGLEYFGWFASGALFYKAKENDSMPLFWLAVTLGLASAMSNYSIDRWSDRAAMLCTVALFATALRSINLQKLLAARWLFFIGTVSYPLYLLHNHLGLGLIGASSGLGLWPPLIPVLVTGLFLVAAYTIHAWYEKAAATWLKRWLLRKKTSALINPARAE